MRSLGGFAKSAIIIEMPSSPRRLHTAAVATTVAGASPRRRYFAADSLHMARWAIADAIRDCDRPIGQGNPAKKDTYIIPNECP